ncbi:MAG: RNA methyltransferase [Pseudomonadota bacterium]
MKSTNISIILVSPQGDANIGATARAMKNFGFTDLRLVNGVPHLTDVSFSWAVDAKDILQSARVYETLDEAVADATFTAAFTRRLGRCRRKHMTIAEASPVMVDRLNNGSIALVFGCEDKGLSNDEIRRCDAIVEIPASKDFQSINLAQSVIIACYELHKYFGDKIDYDGKLVQETFLSRHEITPILTQIDSMLTNLGYENTEDRALRAKILDQFEKIFGRAGLTKRDVAMFEGLISRIEKTTLPNP